MTSARNQIKRGLWWFGSATVVMRIIDVIAVLVVIKILTPEEMGLAALALGVAIILEGLNGLGVMTAIVRADTITKDQQSSLFWFCMGIAVIFTIAAMCASPWIARFYNHPELASMIAVSSLKLILVGGSLVPLQMLTRELKFKQVSGVQATAFFFDAVTKIILALAGFGVWSLIIANLARGLFLFLAVFFIASFRPVLHFAWHEIFWFISFGWRAALSTVITESYKNLDYFLIGRFLGVSTLGIYRVAFDLAMTPIEAIAQPIYRVTYPVFSRLGREGGKLVDSFYDASRYMLILLGPVAVFIYFCAHDTLAIITKTDWLEAVPAVELLCWAALFRAITRQFDNLFYAVNKPNLALYDAVLSLLILGLTMPLALYFFGNKLGVIAVCLSWLGTYPLIFVILFAIAMRVTPLKIVAYIRHLLPIGLALSLMGITIWSCGLIFSGEEVIPLIRLITSGGSGVLVYILFLRFGLGFKLKDLF